MPAANEGGEDDDSPIFAEVTITPLTDVMLVLLIIVMVSANQMVDAAREGRLDVDLPSAGTGSSDATPGDATIIGIMKDGRITVGGEAVDEEQLKTLLKEKMTVNKETPIVIDADGDLAHKSVVRVLDVARQVGVTNIGIGVTPGDQ
ncbi:MAG: biopolymer transporter ExbD [Clostridia bacterium]|nr:biopolymer transporter ExbD [Deltaproteobacteria bacterium]